MNSFHRPTCPHCGYEFDDEEIWYEGTGIYVNMGDCEDTELICPNDDCKKKFNVRCIHEITFIQIDENGDEI